VPSADADSERDIKGLDDGLKTGSTRNFTAIEFFNKLLVLLVLVRWRL